MPEGLPHTTSPRLLRMFMWLHWRVFAARMAKSRRESPLLIFILGAFISGYLYFGYVLFEGGLKYIYRFPAVGPLLGDRILYLVFGFFFVMLVVSNLIIGYTTLFKNRETQWMLSLPIRHRDVYRWKFVEALVVSSWALLFLSAPMLAAYGAVHEVTWQFYVKVALGYLPFLVIPAVAGSWLILFLVRILSRPWTKRIVVMGAVAFLIFIIIRIKPVTESDATGVPESVLFPKLMRGTRMLTSPYLPSTWFADSVKAWTSFGATGLWEPATFNFLLLTSYALFGLLLAFDLGGRVFYGSWSAALSSRAERYQRETEMKRQKAPRMTFLNWLQARVRGLSPQMTALVFKDARIFWRDPAQWTQFMIFFGLLCIYVANLRNVAFEFKKPYWETLISYLNLAASALTLSTLTTRFVYPMFSLEGRRVWILGLSPVGLKRVVLQKFWMSFLVSSFITVSLMVASALMLKLPWWRVIYFAGSIGLMSAALSSLAVGLGALFPNFREENPSKIVSSFGGTLCLVMSFIYNASVVSLLALPDLMQVTNRPLPFPYWVTPVLALALSLSMITIPMFLAIRRVKNLEM